MNRHFGKTLATQDSHIHQTTISFTYTSNHQKLHIYTSHIHQTTTSFTYTLHIYIKTTTSFTYTLHIYIKPPQASHIHYTYTSNPSFTYTSNPSFTYTTNPKLIKASIWVINGRKELGRRSTDFNMKQSRFNAKYEWVNGTKEVERRRKPNRSRVSRVDLV